MKAVQQDFVMAPSQTKDTKFVDTPNDGAEDFAVGSQEEVTNYSVLQTWKWGTLYRSVLFQMVLFGALSLVGPAMSDAISNLGGGGLSTPWLANLANSLSYTFSFFSTILGGPIINKIGIKWACFIAAVAMPLYGSAYYVSARYSIEWYLLTANVISGTASGFLYVGETTAMLSYPKPEDRGFYLGIWSAMRSSGSLIGGAINFSTNSDRASAGGIAWPTYLIFVGFECTAVFWALLLSPTARVRRRDGSKVPMSEMLSWKQEFIALWGFLQNKKTWLIFLPAFYSFFYGGTMGTYLSLHFSVRARALSSLIIPAITIPSVIIFGKLLDSQRWPQRRRAWAAFSLWIIPQTGCFIWIAFEYHHLGNRSTLDYNLDTSRWSRAYVPYLIIFVTGYWTQLTLYWIIGTFSNDMKSSSRVGGVFRAFETAGQAVSYGLSSASIIAPTIPIYVNCALLVLAIPSMILLITGMQKAPASVDFTDQTYVVPDDPQKKE
ncbi:MFS general substrate transporter [Clathrospora elynae]|uniref:MFS general substrate transporter n=1 Tax=Clathrospora elynae TaxID=706981 RepID=A0A6A5SDC4_9PLEO|nr:MFS general substrate transporter [Clathrospora elynae]